MKRPDEVVKEAARSLGFDAVGVCALEPIEREALREWLDAGFAASMRYMHRQFTKRSAPSKIVPGAERAVVLLKNYCCSAGELDAAVPRVASYAQGEDYHHALGQDLDRLVDVLVALGASRDVTRGFVDAGPVPERELAQRAGLGWIAKNTMLIDPRGGSFTFIASVFTDLKLPVDPPFPFDRCGSCQRCLDACPTSAFPAERVLDASRCISYLTIEYRGAFSEDQSTDIGPWLFGCDICQDVCPWNHSFAQPTRDTRFAPRPDIACPDLSRMESVDETEFRTCWEGTALERTGAAGLKRNAVAVRQNLERSTPKEQHP